ncbi:tetratricopeptide repeat protein [Acidovorax sp.]|uniref:tetratricopeptide repeat protein n=1 Tax=Acidovorax sp. TaxID=1872122 RepID=UPI0025BBEBBC|nr:tetratricopeptide repeat protein [Acidovorax sp.]MBL7091103.1 tetratricopeptide repeat protein [Acidovorax sp.]
MASLGNSYGELGQTARAIDYYEQALTILREIGDRQGESADLVNLAEVLVDEGRYPQAIQRALEGVRIGDEISSTSLGSYSNGYLALAYLYASDLPAARAAVEAARQHDEPQNNHYVLALLGVIALRQGDRSAAQQAFAEAVAQADALLAHTAQTTMRWMSRGWSCAGWSCVGTGRICPPPSKPIRPRGRSTKMPES